MNISSARENILKKIRKALTQSTPLPFPKSEGTGSVFKPAVQELEIEFAEQFGNLQGRFVFCLNYSELVKHLREILSNNKWTKIFCKETEIGQQLKEAGFADFHAADLEGCDAAITGCEFLIARTGSIVMSSSQQSGRTVSVYAPVHICIAKSNQLVYDVRNGLKRSRKNTAPTFHR